MAATVKKTLTIDALDGRGVYYNTDTHNIDLKLKAGGALVFTEDGELDVTVQGGGGGLTETQVDARVDAKLTAALAEGGVIATHVATAAQEKATAAIDAALAEDGKIAKAIAAAVEGLVKGSELKAKVDELATVTLADAAGTAFGKAFPPAEG